MATSIGMKYILGRRQMDDDGFGYSAGKFKYNKSQCRYKNAINRSRRADKKKARRYEEKFLKTFC